MAHICAPHVCTAAHTPAGFVSARLRGEYQITRDDRIDLEFKNITLNIGPIKAAEKVRADVSTLLGFATDDAHRDTFAALLPCSLHLGTGCSHTSAELRGQATGAHAVQTQHIVVLWCSCCIRF